MEALFELLLQLFGEIVLQVIVEALAEFGLHGLEGSLEKPRKPIVAAFGFLLLGAVAGGISLLIFPDSLISNPDYRATNLVITPFLAGGVMMLIARQRAKRGQNLVGLDRFAYAFLFAFAMALVRFAWAG